MIKELDENGFVFLDDNNRPYWIAMRYGEPIIAYWHEGNKSWVNLRKATQSDIWMGNKRALPDDQAEIYHKQHKQFLV